MGMKKEADSSGSTTSNMVVKLPARLRQNLNLLRKQNKTYTETDPDLKELLDNQDNNEATLDDEDNAEDIKYDASAKDLKSELNRLRDWMDNYEEQTEDNEDDDIDHLNSLKQGAKTDYEVALEIYEELIKMLEDSDVSVYGEIEIDAEIITALGVNAGDTERILKYLSNMIEDSEEFANCFHTDDIEIDLTNEGGTLDVTVYDDYIVNPLLYLSDDDYVELFVEANGDASLMRKLWVESFDGTDLNERAEVYYRLFDTDGKIAYKYKKDDYTAVMLREVLLSEDAKGKTLDELMLQFALQFTGRETEVTNKAKNTKYTLEGWDTTYLEYYMEKQLKYDNSTGSGFETYEDCAGFV